MHLKVQEIQQLGSFPGIIVITDEEERVIATRTGIIDDDDRKLFNVMAAAPDLLEACRFGFFENLDGPALLEHAAEYLQELGAHDAEVEALRRKAALERAAIAKAEG